MMKENWVLKAERLSKRYGPGCGYCAALTGAGQSGNRCPVCGTVVACSEVSCVLEQGEVLGVVGESGSGQSTLMQLVDLSLAPDSGELWYREPDRTLAAPDEPSNLMLLDKYGCAVFRNERLGMGYQRPELGMYMHFSVGGMSQRSCCWLTGV